MYKELIREINGKSTQRPIHPAIEANLRGHDAIQRLLYYDVPPIDMDELFEFCSNFDVFGRDEGKTSQFIQLYVLGKFMEELGSDYAISGPLDLSGDRDFGNYMVIGENNGLTASLRRKITRNKRGILQTYAEEKGDVNCVFEIK